MTRAQWLWWLLLTAVGVTLVALPDSDQRLFSLSAEHGPSALDAVGVLLLLSGWLVLDLAVWRGRRRLARRLGRQRVAAGGFVVACGGLVVTSIAGDVGRWWMVGALLLAAAQVLAAVVVTQPEGR